MPHYAIVPNARQLRFAPGGELFVASPDMPTTSGGRNGLAEVVVVPDDNHDGYGDQVLTYATGLPSTQGLLFANDSLYYQDGTQIISEPYVSGSAHRDQLEPYRWKLTSRCTSRIFTGRRPSTSPTPDRFFVGNGGGEGESCQQPDAASTVASSS